MEIGGGFLPSTVAIQNGHLHLIYTLNVVIFHSYLSVPEGNQETCDLKRGFGLYHDEISPPPKKKQGLNLQKCFFLGDATSKNGEIDGDGMGYILKPQQYHPFGGCCGMKTDRSQLFFDVCERESSAIPVGNRWERIFACLVVCAFILGACPISSTLFGGCRVVLLEVDIIQYSPRIIR